MGLCLLVFGATALASSVDKVDLQAGANLYRSTGCEHCHGSGGLGAPKGPPLVGKPFRKEWTAEKIKNQLILGGKKMPAFSDDLSDDDIAKLIVYLRAKHRPAPTVPVPAEKYQP